MPMTVKDRLQIGYEPPPAPLRRRRIRSLVTFIALLAVVGPSAWIGGPRAWNRVVLLCYQGRATQYSAPADQVVFADDPREVTQLLRTTDYQRFDGTCESGAMRVAGCWEELYHLCSPPGRRPSATLFLHARRTGTKAPRLVVVELIDTVPGIHSPGWLDVEAVLSLNVLKQGSALFNPEQVTQSLTRIRLGPPQTITGLRFFAGQLDRADESHFSIAYQLNGKPGNLDGWLLDDDTVRLEVRGNRLTQ
jgi:hypothetical protein